MQLLYLTFSALSWWWLVPSLAPDEVAHPGRAEAAERKRALVIVSATRLLTRRVLSLPIAITSLGLQLTRTHDARVFLP